MNFKSLLLITPKVRGKSIITQVPNNFDTKNQIALGTSLIKEMIHYNKFSKHPINISSQANRLMEVKIYFVMPYR